MLRKTRGIFVLQIHQTDLKIYIVPERIYQYPYLVLLL